MSLILVGMGCSRAQIRSDFDREVNFGTYRSFDWMEKTYTSSNDPYAQNTLTEKRIRNATIWELESKGYRRETTGEPDFLVTYHVGVENRVDVTSYGYSYFPYRHHGHHGYGGYGYSGQNYSVYRYKEGTLILDFVDPETNQLVWRGSYVNVVSRKGIGEKKIKKAIRHILEKFPPEKY